MQKIAELTHLCDEFGVPVELNECWEKGGEGGTDIMKKSCRELAEALSQHLNSLYKLEDSFEGQS